MVSDAGDGRKRGTGFPVGSSVTGPLLSPEGVFGTAIDVGSPVQPSPLECLTKSQDLAGGNDWIFRTSTNEDRALHTCTSVITRIGQAGMYECHRLERYSRPSKFEHDASSCTITEREKSTTVDVRLREKLIEGSVANRPHSINICQKRYSPRQHRFRLP